MNRTKVNLIKFILAYICTIVTGIVTGWGITKIDILLPLLCLFFYILFDFITERLISKNSEWSLKNALALDDITAEDAVAERKFALPIALILSLSVTVGRHFDVWDAEITPFNVADIFIFLLLTVLFVFLIIVLFRSTDRLNAETGAADSGSAKINCGKIFLYAGIMIVCWLPYYLTLFPGNLGKDTFESVDMVLGNIPWTNHHPIFFTMLIDAAFAMTGGAGSVTVSLAVFSFLHMVCFAFVLAYIAGYITKISKGPGKWGVVTLVFFSLHPFFPMYSIYITKDVLFSCALALLVLKLHEGKHPIHIGIAALFTMLLRNNGLMIIVLLALILLIAGRRKGQKSADLSKTMLLSFVVPILLFTLFKSVSYNVLNIEPESFAESASIPLQQVGYVIDAHTDAAIKDVLGEEDDMILKSIMPYERVREIYDLGYVDPYKFDASFDDAYFNEHSSDFLKIWAKLLPHYLGDYVKAYLAQTAGYWHYGETNTVATQGVWEDNTVGVERIDLIQRMTGVSLYGIIEKLMLGMRKAPLLCILSSMAMQFYAVILTLVCLRRRTVRRVGVDASGVGCKSVAIGFTPLILLWVSIMIATPAFCLFRYMFAFFILWPYTIYMMLFGDNR